VREREEERKREMEREREEERKREIDREREREAKKLTCDTDDKVGVACGS
jgi:hypothetical protein